MRDISRRSTTTRPDPSGHHQPRRKNVKTSECAFILLFTCAGPSIASTRTYCCAQSRDQAAVLFELTAKIVRLSPKLQPVIQIKDTLKELLCPPLGVTYKALSADASTAYGRSPALTVFDELGQERWPRSALFEALETATAAQEDPLTVIVSTQAASDQDLLSVLIDHALAGHDPSTVLRFDTAPEDTDPFSEETIRLANPAYDVFLNQKEVLAQAAAARVDASARGELSQFDFRSAGRRLEPVHRSRAMGGVQRPASQSRGARRLWRARPGERPRPDRAGVDFA